MACKRDVHCNVTHEFDTNVFTCFLQYLYIVKTVRNMGLIERPY